MDKNQLHHKVCFLGGIFTVTFHGSTWYVTVKRRRQKKSKNFLWFIKLFIFLYSLAQMLPDQEKIQVKSYH